MTMRTQGLLRAVWAAALAAVPAVTGMAAEAVPTDRLLPPNVFAYFTVPNAPELAKRADGSLLGQLRKDPALAEFIKEVEKVWNDKSEEAKKAVGLGFDELLAIPSGEASVAVMQPPGKPLGVVVLLNFGDKQKSIDTLLDKADEALKEQGAKRTETEADDTTIVVHTLKAKADDDDDDDVDAKKDPQKFAYFVRDTWLVLGNEVSSLEAILARWDGKHTQTFAENASWKYILERCQPADGDAALAWYVNPVQLVQAAMAQSGNAGAAMMVMGFMPALGVNNFKAMGGAYDLATEEYDSVSRTLMYVDQPTSGVLNMFQFPTAELAPPRWVSATASGWFGMNWDVGGAYAALEKTVDLFRGQGYFGRIIDQMAANEQGPKLHVKKDFIDLLEGRIDFYAPAPSGKDDDDEAAAADKFLMAFRLKDGAKMSAVLTKLANFEGFPGKTREFKGTTIYEVSRAALGSAQTMGYAVSEGQLLVSSDVTLVEDVLRGDTDRAPLADSPEFKSVFRKFPAKTSIASFQRQDAQMKAVYDMMRTGQGAAIFEDIDFTKLPPFEALKKYLAPTGSYAEPDKKGVLFVSFSLKAKN